MRKTSLIYLTMEYLKLFLESINIVVIVFIMMVLVDWLNVLTRGRIDRGLGRSRFRQYLVSSFLGATPGCLGDFMVVSFYQRALISFGAVLGGFIASCGDEAFVMLSLFPLKALLLFSLLFLFGLIFSPVADWFLKRIKIEPCPECKEAGFHDEKFCNCYEPTIVLSIHRWHWFRYFIVSLLFVLFISYLFGFLGAGEGGWGWERITLVILLVFGIFVHLTVPDHYLFEHILGHIIKKHLWRVFLWTFFAIFLVELGLDRFNLEQYIRAHPGWTLLISAIVGIIPESGPHLVFVFLFKESAIPFSILFTNSFIQDGHAMLPLLSYSVRSSVLIKVFKIVSGLLVGGLFYLIGW